MTNHWVWQVLMILAPLLGLTGFVGADPQQDGKSRADEFLAYARREAAAHTFRAAGSDRPLTLRPEPVLNMSFVMR